MFSLKHTTMKVKLQNFRKKRNKVTIQTDSIMLEIIMMIFSVYHARHCAKR